VLSGKRHTESPLIIAGIVLLLLGLLLGVGILYTIGIILIIVGAVLWVVGSTGRAVGGRRHYY
jgi:membrane-bound ClpP family serine protease